MSASSVLWLEAVGVGDVPRVGGKNAWLGEMIAALGGSGVQVPPGFATTADAFRDYVAANGIAPAMRQRLVARKRGEASLQDTGAAVRRLVLEGEFPAGTAEAIRPGLPGAGQPPREGGSGRGGAQQRDRRGPAECQLRRPAGDLPERRGRAGLDRGTPQCFASLFTDRAISYRDMQGFDHERVALSAGVQAMVRADLGGLGIMFSIDTGSGFPGMVMISAGCGLGEPIVRGAVDPDRYLVFRPPLADPAKVPILEEARRAQAQKMVYASGGNARTALVETTARERDVLVLDDPEVLHLARPSRSIAVPGRPTKAGTPNSWLTVTARLVGSPWPVSSATWSAATAPLHFTAT